MPGSFLTRHSVPGAGLLSPIVLTLVLWSVVSLWRGRSRPDIRYAAPFLLAILLFPLPDIFTTSTSQPPYTFAIFPMILALPFAVGFGLSALGQPGRDGTPPDQNLAASSVLEDDSRNGQLSAGGGMSWRDVLPWAGRAALALFLIAGIRFDAGAYEDYPLVSADYWGWQFGPRPITDSFVEHRAEYDQYFLDPDFNEAHVFLAFYLADDDDLRSRSRVGSLEWADPTSWQIFGIRKERYDRFVESGDGLVRYMRVVDVIYYPNGEIAFYMVEVVPFPSRPDGALAW